MEFVNWFVDLFLNLDTHLGEVIANYGVWTYLVLFVIIFCETGLVVTPILPGDSLLFAVGVFTAREPGLDLPTTIVLLTIAAILGDAVNYAAGHYIGPKVFRRDGARFFKREHLDRTQRFYKRHGGKTIILARFVPIVRTFAPFVAGIGNMSYVRFATYNIVGAIVWVTLFVTLGHFFGDLPMVRRNFTLVALGIVAVSLIPIAVEYWRGRAGAVQPAEGSGQ